jgi:hypothetical protein
MGRVIKALTTEPTPLKELSDRAVAEMEEKLSASIFSPWPGAEATDTNKA